MSQLISTRVPDSTADRLKRYATRKKRSVNEVAISIFEEWLRLDEFRDIEFRDTPDGVRRAYMKNSRLSVAWVIRVAKSYDMNTENLLAYWPDRSREWVQAALNYYGAFSEEIDTELELMAAEAELETLKRRFPMLESFTVPEVPGGDSGT
jgi:uncharacterized protein (DUF433 family)